jgi:hypothetical protein
LLKPAVIAKLEVIIVLASAVGLLFLAILTEKRLTGFAVTTLAIHRDFARLGKDELHSIPKWSVKHRDLLWLMVVGFGYFFLGHFWEGQKDSMERIREFNPGKDFSV